MVYALCILGGLVVGGVVAWLIAAGRRGAAVSDAERRGSAAEGIAGELRAQADRAAADFKTLRTQLEEESRARVKAETQCAEAMKRLEGEKELLDEAKTKLSDAFRALSADALKSNNAEFLQLAKESLGKVVETGKGDLKERQEAIKGLVDPLSNTLKGLDEQLRKMAGADATIKQQLDVLGNQTTNLVNVLRRPEGRGRWGEMALRRLLELSGMTENVDFFEQKTLASGEDVLRPDFLVRLPKGCTIVIDSKVPLDAFLSALEATSEERRRESVKQHAQQLRTQISKLSSKEYHKYLESAPDYVIMFLPAESLFSEALKVDPDIYTDALQQRVVIATPANLFAILQTVAHIWRQERMAANALQISQLGKELYERITIFAEHIEDMHKGLKRTNDAFNNAVGSLETRVLPQARRFRDLGAVSAAEIPVIEPVETEPRKLSAPELTGETQQGPA